MKLKIEIPIAEAIRPEENFFSEFENYTLALDAGTSVQIPPRPDLNAFSIDDALLIIATITNNLAAGILGNWIYDKFKDKSKHAIIGKTKVPLQDKEALVREILNYLEDKEARES